MKKFIKVFFYSIGFSALNLLMQLVVGVIVTIAYLILFKGPEMFLDPNAIRSMNIEEIVIATLFPTLIIAAFLTFGVAWLLHLIFRRRFIERLSFQKTSITFIALSLLAGACLQLPIGYLIHLVEITGIAPDVFTKYVELMEPLMAPQNLVLQIITIGIIAPVLEECIFRGLVFHQLRKNVPVALALIIQALLFGISHMNIIQGTYAFLTGILMGLLLLWSDSLILPICMHVGMNTMGVLFSHFGEGLSDTAFYILTAVSVILIIVSMVLIGRMTKKHPQLTLESDIPSTLQE